MSKSRLGILLGLGPILAFLVVFFVVPVGYMLAYSFRTYDPILIATDQVTLRNYLTLLNDPYAYRLIARTLRVALATSVAAVLVGYPVALRMWNARGTERMILAAIAMSPMLTSLVVLGYAWMVIFAPRTGLVATLFGPLAPRMLFTETGIIIGLTHQTSVFVILTIGAALENISRDHIRAAEILGASSLRTFLSVILPLSLPGIISGFFLVFAISSSAFMVPLLIGGRQAPLLASYAYELNRFSLNWPLGGAASTVLLFVSLASIAAMTWLTNRLRVRYGAA